MEKLDRLDWASGLVVEAYGIKIGIRCNLAPMPEEIQAYLPPGAKEVDEEFVDLLFSLIVGGPSPRKGVKNYHLLYLGMERRARTLKFPEILETLENISQIFLAEWAKDHVFLHAGVVGWQDRAIILPGRSLAGKTTLVATLLQAGASYYSDEYAVIDREGKIKPYPRRLSLRQEEGKIPKRLRAKDLGAKLGVKPLTPGLILFTQYRPGKDSARLPGPLPAGQACLRLMDNAVPALSQPRETLDALHGLAFRVPAYRGLRGEADDFVPLLLRNLDSLTRCA